MISSTVSQMIIWSILKVIHKIGPAVGHLALCAPFTITIPLKAECNIHLFPRDGRMGSVQPSCSIGATLIFTRWRHWYSGAAGWHHHAVPAGTLPIWTGKTVTGLINLPWFSTSKGAISMVYRSCAVI